MTQALTFTPGFKKKLTAFLIFDAALLLLVLFLFLLRGERQEVNELRELGMVVYPEPFELDVFRLQRADGSVFELADLNDRWTLFFFGFTNCPSVCPLTMQELGRFFANSENDPLTRQLQVVMVSVDPQNDSPADVQAYVERYDTKFIGLSGEAAEIKSLAKQFFVAYTDPVPVDDSMMVLSHENHAEHRGHGEQMQMTQQSGDLEYLIEHNGHLALVSPQGDFHAVVRPPVRATTLGEALSRVIQSAD